MHQTREDFIMLTVTLLGTAATLPQPDRALSSAVFSVNGRHILLDCGEGTQLALHRQRISPMKIDLIALTHYHGDHMLGLPGLLQTMDTMGRTAPLIITGPEEGHAPILAAILTLADELAYPVSFRPMPPEGLPLHTLHSKWPMEAHLDAFPTVHRIASQGYRLTLGRMRRLHSEKALALEIPRPLWRHLQSGHTVTIDSRTIRPDDVCGPKRPGLRVVFTGDTAPCDAVEQASRSADLLIMDATYADDLHDDKAALYGHSTFTQTAALAARAGVKQLWLTHYSAMVTDPAEYLPAAQALCPHAECGTDGKSVMLTFRSDE